MIELVDVMVANITFLWFLLLLMLHFAVNMLYKLQFCTFVLYSRPNVGLIC